MTQPWIHKPKTDSVFILAPPFLVLGIMFFFQKWLLLLEHSYSFYVWLFVIVFIDVSHVYATLFKTYFVKNEFRKRKKLYIRLPIFCFLISFLLYQLGSLLFWSFLAYVAVFHFIRQQYGFMRLYAKYEKKTFAWLDALIIYTATIYPMLFWFLSPKRNFNWFVDNEFLQLESPSLIVFFSWIYYGVMAFYFFRTIFIAFSKQYFNIPKNLIILGTILSWYFGIVYFNNDLIFTSLNVITHGIPYIALVYLNEISNKDEEDMGVLRIFKNTSGMFFYLFVLIIIAFSEEFLWEGLVWKEQISIQIFNLDSWHFTIVPLLSVPQFTHYLLDGFIWKKR
jgi:hypothetical protein